MNADKVEFHQRKDFKYVTIQAMWQDMMNLESADDLCLCGFPNCGIKDEMHRSSLLTRLFLEVFIICVYLRNLRIENIV